MNNTTNKVLELVERFKKYNDCTITAKIYAPQSEMSEASNYLNCHLYQPFELNTYADRMSFTYRENEVNIIVESIEVFRIKKSIEEVA